jgi:hypothetical protein
MATKRKILNSKQEKDFILYGIASSVNDYRLAWLLNNKFNIELKKVEDLQVELKKGGNTTCYSRYSNEDELTKVEILANKDLNSIKLVKLDFDFFLKFNTEFNQTINIKENLSHISELIFASEIIISKHISDKIIRKIMFSFS